MSADRWYVEFAPTETLEAGALTRWVERAMKRIEERRVEPAEVLIPPAPQPRNLHLRAQYSPGNDQNRGGNGGGTGAGEGEFGEKVQG